MPLQLTPRQEERLRSIVDAGAFSSVEEALDAAVSFVEQASVPEFEGSQRELEELLLEGQNSGEPVVADDAFWNRLRLETEAMAAEYTARRSHL